MKQYLDIAALAERLRIRRSTLYAWTAQGTIPHLKLGRLLRFDPDEIEAWLQAHRQEVTPEPTLPKRRHGTDNIDVLIATAKADAYNSCRETRSRQGQPRR